ncbi:thiamine biosynthesis protein [Moraxella porci DSM 25326]|uniref:FAD:protein FMN transferase n=1 Tax=Moraxella porci DSM 25326 TaxID=573983 RepID=A0A1T0CL36_9GAMM|nr:FAD:protein FMN transferase [Moraxella porci]OOS23062.1 thiamine biosynthesis protein [Moraxella porci DSM 25326]
MKYTPIAIICSAALISACSDQPTYQKIEGQTMGTSYHISYQHPDGVDAKAIQASIDQRLQAINISMSTYMDDSTISKFNRLPSATPIQIDADFAKVLADSQSIYQASNQAFDPTVYPLVELWGFGKQMSVERLQSPPNADEIAKAKAVIGLDKVLVNGQSIQKTVDGVGLDFSAIAKGYAVDVIAQTLKDSYGITNYMVEIGGEVATLGQNDKGKPWTLAVDAPVADSSVKTRDTITTLTQPKDGSLHIATSGNYRNSVEYEGVRYSHTINPVTGNPVADGAPSITVLHDSVALADGWATALTAMPYADALATANREGIQALFIIENSNKTGFDIVKTDAMQQKFPN